MESNFLTQIKNNDVAEAYDRDSQLFTHKEANEIPFHRDRKNFKLGKVISVMTTLKTLINQHSVFGKILILAQFYREVLLVLVEQMMK